MDKCCYGIALVVTAAVVLGGVLVSVEGSSTASAAAEEDTSSSCVQQLIPCLRYLNGTKHDVPNICCDPLKDVIQSDPQCLCTMITNRGASQAERAGINITQAQQLPGRCGIHVNPISCMPHYYWIFQYQQEFSGSYFTKLLAVPFLENVNNGGCCFVHCPSNFPKLINHQGLSHFKCPQYAMKPQTFRF